MDLSLSAKIESLLFYTTEPMSYDEIGELLDASIENITVGLKTLRQSLEGRGLVIIEHQNTVLLATHPLASDMIRDIIKKQRERELSRAALETLSIVLYRPGITKSQIDYIRGVNSQFILRNLLVRGLIEKHTNVDNKRQPLYHPTLDTLSYMGIQNVNALPNYEQLRTDFEKISTEHDTLDESYDETDS